MVETKLDSRNEESRRKRRTRIKWQIK